MGIGVTEILLIIIVGYFLFGPEKLPKVIAEFIKTINDIMKIKDEVTKPVNDIKKDLEKSVTNVKNDLNNSISEIKNEVSKPVSEIKETINEITNSQNENKDLKNK